MKKWYQSKTIWLNYVAISVACLGLINEPILQAFGIKSPSQFLIIIGFVNGVGNVLLRTFSTSKPIE